MIIDGLQCPTVAWKRWGFLYVVAALLPLVAGCGGTQPHLCDKPQSMRYSAPVDSLGLSGFLALPLPEREQRGRQAREAARAAAKARRIDLRIGQLTTAAGLDPAEPAYWLSLAELWRARGNYLQTDACLEQAMAAVNHLTSGSTVMGDRGEAHRKEMALAVALQRAWLHYDRAEWREAMPWVRTALRAESGNKAALQIRGLLEGAMGHQGRARAIADDLRRKDGFSTDVAWILANLEGALGHDRVAFSHFLGLRPDERRVAECYRDMGRAAERVGEWSYAGRWYGESAAALPYHEITCLTERRHARVGGAPGDPELPFWLVGGTSYVTGSISAYLAFAFEKFEAATTTTERSLWAGMVVDAAGTCLRLGLEKPDVYRARGLVFAQTDRLDRALADLRTARNGMDPRSTRAARLDAEIGHLLLLQKQSDAATRHLRQALTVTPDGAQAWSDLGLALIMAGDDDAGEEALTKAIALDPELATAWYNRGLLYLHSGDLDRAAHDLGEAAALAPDNMEIARLLQQVRRQNK